jgi:2-oxo-4-hydroxy-4-carboxy-5-ureidoimidazoline decarboxylase
VAAARPFADRAALDRAMEEAFDRLTPEALGEAVRRHPRLGESAPRGQVGDREQGWSKGEQATLAATSTDAGKLAERNAAYEKAFGWVFLLCATGLTEAQVLAALESRMTNVPDQELAIAAEELRKIATLRIDKLLERTPRTEGGAG